MQHDWDKIRAEYVAGKETYEQLAARHGMLKSQLGKRAKQEDWPGQRAAYRRSVAEATIRKRRYKDSEKLVGLMEAADQMVGHIQRLMADEDQFRRNVDSTFVKTESGAWEHRKQEYLTKKVDTKALANAARALSEATRVVRDLYELPTKQEREKGRLETRRLKLLEEKRGGAVDMENSGVAFMPQPLPEQEDALEVDQ